MKAPRTNSVSQKLEQIINNFAPQTRKDHLAAKRANRIAALNDQLRQQGRGGSIVMTQGISNLEPAARKRIIIAVRDFAAFTPDNDPYGERDCAVLEVDGQRVIWKIDAYDRSIRVGSPDPADPKVTHRVLTIMLADEY